MIVHLYQSTKMYFIFSRENWFSLLVVIATKNNEARGALFYDDGDTVGKFVLWNF